MEPKEKSSNVELEAQVEQQQAQIKEMELIINALESSNKLMEFRLGVVIKQNQDLQKQLSEAKVVKEKQTKKQTN